MPTTSHRARRLAGAATLLGGLLATGLVARPAAADTGTYAGSAAADLVHVDAVSGILPTPLGPSLANVDLGRSTAAVDSNAGLGSGASSTARAANLDAAVGSLLNLPGLVVEAKQAAPPDNATPTVADLLQIPAAPLVTAGLTKSTAFAHPASTAVCGPSGTPISSSSSEAANLAVLPSVVPGAGSLVNLSNGANPVSSSSQVAMVGTGATRSLQSTATTQVTALTLLAGTASPVQVEVVAPPVLTATASGQPGGAGFTYSTPVLRVTVGTQTTTLDANTVNMTITLPLGILKLGIGVGDGTAAANGTSIDATASLLDVQLLPLIGTTPLATVKVAPMAAKALVPVGGIRCDVPIDEDNPLRDARKDASSSVVAAGQVFTYTITVPNRGDAALTNVKVVDTITAPAGTSIVSTVPAASSVNGLVATWDDIGPIAPNETKVLQLAVKAPSTMAAGAHFANSATITAIYKGKPVTKTPTADGPDAFTPPAGPCSLDGSTISESHEKVKAGETFTYFVNALNDGGKPCNDVTVTQTLDPNETFVSCTASCTVSGRTVTWHLGTIQPGSSITVAAVVKVNDGVPPGTRLPGVARIKSGTETANVKSPGPIVTGESVLAPSRPALPNIPADKETARGGAPLDTTATTLPHTGGPAWPAFAGLGLLTLALATRRKLRTEG